MSILPKSFQDWKICIEQRCGIPLTPDFAKTRLSIYSNGSLPETQRFVKLYGDEHFSNIKKWLNRVIQENESLKTK